MKDEMVETCGAKMPCGVSVNIEKH